jgi:hypothetical protein
MCEGIRNEMRKGIRNEMCNEMLRIYVKKCTEKISMLSFSRLVYFAGLIMLFWFNYAVLV